MTTLTEDERRAAVEAIEQDTYLSEAEKNDGHIQTIWFRACEYMASKAAHGESKWISVDEKLPDLGIPVWLFEEGRIYMGGRCDDSEGWLWGQAYDEPYIDNGVWKSELYVDDEYKPTHWQPLPQPPAVEDGK